MGKEVNGTDAHDVAPWSDELANKPAFALTAREMLDHIKQTVRSAVAEASAAAPASNQAMWMTVKQAHRLLGKSDRWLLQQLRAGTIQGHKVGNTWRIARAEIERVQREGLREI